MLVLNKLNLIQHLVDFLLHLDVIDSLESCVQFDVLSYSQVVEEHVMLGTDAQIFSQVLLVCQDVNAVEHGLALSWTQKSC